MTYRRVAEFVGVSTEPGRGIRAGVGPYEFFTDGGVHVYLHDADFVGLIFLPEATGRFYFRYDSQTAPHYGAEATPVVELTFSHVGPCLWETDLEALPDTEHRGQVSVFAWDTGDGFDLITYALHLSFAAARMEARLLAAAPFELR